MSHSRDNQNSDRQSYDMPNDGQKPTEMESIHASKTCYFDGPQVGLHYTYKMHAQGDQTSHGQSYIMS